MRGRFWLGLSLISWLATAYTLYRVGRFYALSFSVVSHQATSPFWYVGGVLLVLGAHEYGHMRRATQRGLNPIGPFFWPMPLQWAALLPWHPFPPVGTLGAFVRLPRLRSLSGMSQWDIAAAGPVYGLVASLACLAVGVALSVPMTSASVGRFAVPWLVDVLVPDGLAWHPLVTAGWLGVMVTGVNLLPLPSLDGFTLWNRWRFLSIWQRMGTLASAAAVVACLPW